MNDARNAVFRRLLDTQDGSLFLSELAILSGAYSMSHVQGDHVQTAFNEGRRSLFNDIMTIMRLPSEEQQKQIINKSVERYLTNNMETALYD